MRQVETLQPSFHEAYDQMVAAVEQEAELEHESQTASEDTTTNEEEPAPPTLGELPRIVASMILQSTMPQRQEVAASLIEVQQDLPPEAVSLGNFLGCLAACLRGETPDTTVLEVPFTDLWQEFQSLLSSDSDKQE